MKGKKGPSQGYSISSKTEHAMVRNLLILESLHHTHTLGLEMEVTSTLQHKTTPESLEHVFGECAHYEYIKEIKSGQILFILGIWGYFGLLKVI